MSGSKRPSSTAATRRLAAPAPSIAATSTSVSSAIRGTRVDDCTYDIIAQPQRAQSPLAGAAIPSFPRLLPLPHGCEALGSKPVPAKFRDARADGCQIGCNVIGDRRHSRSLQAQGRRFVLDLGPDQEEDLACARKVREITARKISAIGA